MLFITLLFSCKKSDEEKPSLEKILPKHLTSSHYNYFMSANDYVDTVFQEHYINWLLAELKVNLTHKIDFYKFKNIDQIYELTGFRGNGFERDGKIYLIWTIDNHESVHSVINTYYGFPRVIFNEGIAVAHQAYWVDGVQFINWNGTDFNIIAKNLLRQGSLAELVDLIDNTSYRTIDPNITYPVSGSFVKYLIDKYGVASLLNFIKISNWNDSNQKVFNDFESIFGLSLNDAWSNWLDFIRNY